MSGAHLPPLKAPAHRPQSLGASHFWPSQHFCLCLHYSWQVCFPLPLLAPTSAPSLQGLLSVSMHPPSPAFPHISILLPLVDVL